MKSTKPFPETLKSLMEMQEVGHRELTRRCEAHGWGSLGTINRLVNGELRPTQRAMAAVARALNEPPETFAEYRLGAMRERLDPEAVGLPKALRALARCEKSA
jgi:transcriptional regulator with XRE-family HTH domain